MRILSNLLRATATLLAGLALLAGCGGGGGGSACTGTLSLSITDQPACGYDHVFVTVERVRVHQSESATDSDAGWQEIPIIDAPRRIDLHSLTNGVLEPLGQTVLPAGKYTQMRLVLADNNGTPLANSVVLSDSKHEEALKTPSGQQTGLKMNVDITVEPDKVADFVIDFDACKSVVVAGSSGQYLLKPVMSVIPVVTEAGQRVIGYFLRLRRPGKTSLFYKPSNRLNQKIKDRLCRFFQDSLNLNVLTESKRETNCKRIMETQKNEKLWRLHDKKQPHHVQIDLAMTVAWFDSLSSICMLLLMLFCLILFMDFMELPH